VVSSFFLYYDLSRLRPQPRQQLLKPRFHKIYLTISLTLKKSTIISRFVMNYKLNFKSYVMFMIFDYVMLYVYGTINRALEFSRYVFPITVYANAGLARQ
jgi:hypothetical protein